MSMNKSCILFVEENENILSNRIVEDSSVFVVLLRFKQNFNFSKSYLEKTKDTLSFVLDKESVIQEEIKRFKNFCKINNIKVEFFYNNSEYNQELVQNFASLLKLKNTLTKEQSIIVRDKVKMKDWLRKIGLKTMDYSIISSKQDIINFSNKYNGFPIILKWRKGLSSIDVYKINKIEDINKLNIDYSSKRFMVEEYSPYVIWCLDSIVQNGKILKTFITWLPYTNLSFAEKKDKFVQITVNSKPEEIKFDTDQLNQLIINNLNLKNGYIHLEAFINKEGQPIICEFAWRTSGEHMLSNHSKAFNIDVYKILIDIMVGREINIFKNTEDTRCVGDMFLPIYNGKIKKISSFNDFKNMKGVLDGEIKYKNNDEVITKRQYTDSSGWLQIEGKTKEEVLKRMTNIYNKFILERY